MTRCVAMRSRSRARTEPTISLSAAQSRSTLIAPVSSRDEHKVEGRHTQHRSSDCGAAREAQRDDDDRQKIYHGDVYQVEAGIHRETGEGADRGRADCPRVALPAPLHLHDAL